MSMNISSYPQSQNKAKVIGAGSVGAIAGMSAYFLPVMPDRFVRTAHEIMKEEAEEKIIKLNESAINLSNGNRLKPEQKLFLSQEGIAETFADINAKANDLKRIIIDRDYIKTVKENLANNFADYKKSEALRDPIASKAFQKIRWTNFAWGAGICFVLGAVLSAGSKNTAQSSSI